jgi:uncharacterized SAM-binding protein YcdF (DUF218 family)
MMHGAGPRPPVPAIQGLSRLGAALCWGLTLWLSAATLLELYGASRPIPEDAAAVAVAGASVHAGGRPSPALLARTTRAVQVFRRTEARTLAFTGGLGDEPPAEAEVAERIAIAQGVPRDVMLREERSTSTEENASELFEMLGDVHLVVVTDRYHVLRCERVFGRYFSDVQVVGSVSPRWTRMRGALREVLALGFYAVLGRLS